MEQFLVGTDGLLSETAALEQAAWYRLQAGANPLDFEAHFMLMRGFEALRIEAPFEKRGVISKPRFGVLRLLYQAEDHRMIMTDIVQSLNVSPTNITKLVDGLEKAGLVRRAGNVRDKRRVWVELLPEGKEAVEELLPSVVDHVHHLWRGLNSEEKRVLIHLLSKLRLHILTGSATPPENWIERSRFTAEATA